MSELHAELDEQGIPDDQKNSALFEKVSAGLKVAEKKIDNKDKAVDVKKEPFDNPQKKSFDLAGLSSEVKDFAVRNHCVVTNAGKNYVTTEVWQYILSRTGLIPTFMMDDENANKKSEDYTVACTCILQNKTGNIVSQATMIATNGEDFLKNEDTYTVWGMAQTRALCRAVKNVYGFVVKDAGFTPTPLCEIDFVKSTKKQEKEGE